MKRFKVIFFLGIAFIMGCDPVLKMKTNGLEKFKINAPCGDIEISSTTATGVYHFQLKSLNGDFDIDTDSLKIDIETENYKKPKLYFDEGNLKVSGKFKLKQGQSLKFTISTGWIDDSKHTKSPVIIIPPNRFLTCGEVPLITDTIRITRK